MSEHDYTAMRKAMIDGQLRTSAVNDPRVVAALQAVPRERFVPADRQAAAYIDRTVPLGGGRALNTPLATARLLNELQPRGDERLLLVGAATGYGAAVASLLVAEVFALEEDTGLAAEAEVALAAAENVTVVSGPLARGHAAGAPYDLVLIDGVIEAVPEALIDQLAPGGRLATAVLQHGVSRLAVGVRTAGGFGLRMVADAEAAHLPGFARPAEFRF